MSLELTYLDMHNLYALTDLILRETLADEDLRYASHGMLFGANEMW
jgi:hypothetical protein